VLTGSHAEQDLVHCYALGANAYLRKSVDFDVLTETARTLGAFWLGLNEPGPIITLPERNGSRT
jgi:CheY-like chemotaxis protein